MNRDTITLPWRRLALTMMLILAAARAADTVRVIDWPSYLGPPDWRTRQRTFSLMNELCNYSLTYAVAKVPDSPDEGLSMWAKTWPDFALLAMTEPARTCWNAGGFVDWVFDTESLAKRPATLRVLRDGGADGVIEYTWDTPKVKATLRFALAARSDLLVMYGTYEPKEPVTKCTIRLLCFPAGITGDDSPTLAVTTAGGTAKCNATVNLDLTRQRWVLFEETAPVRPSAGPAGLIIGTPDAFLSATIPATIWGIRSTLTLKPGQRSFALGLAEFPMVPDTETNRAYFRECGEAHAKWLQTVAATGLEKPLPPGLVPGPRRQKVAALLAKRFERKIDRWKPNPEPLRFAWAKPLPDPPISTALFCYRWCAWETMELARRLDLRVQPLQWDETRSVSETETYPYARSTGKGPVGAGAAGARIQDLCRTPDIGLFMCVQVDGWHFPPPALDDVADRVKAGKGLFIAGHPGLAKTYPATLFATPDAALTQAVLAGVAWSDIPGYRSDEAGQALGEPVTVYRLGTGLVVVLRVSVGGFGALVPNQTRTEGMDGVFDRSLALAARAVLAAVGRLPTEPLEVGALAPDKRSLQVKVATPPTVGTLQVRVMNDLDQTLSEATLPLAGDAAQVPLPALPGGSRCWLDVILRDANQRSLDFASVLLPAADDVLISGVEFSPVRKAHETTTPLAPLPGGGALDCRATVKAAALDAAQAVWEVADAFDRVLARGVSPVPASGGEIRCTLSLPRPVTVCHRLDVRIERGNDVLAVARQRFTLPVPYPYDDFTVLMYTYAGRTPVLGMVERRCYELGADMMDLCHMGTYPDATARRQYEISSRSGLRVLPYVTRIFGEANEQHVRVPCLHDPQYLETTDNQVRIQARQAAPYSPAAFTLGNENSLLSGSSEACHSPASVAAFQDWLRTKYGTLEKLNAAWIERLGGFDDVRTPMLLEEAAKQTASFAPWIDHKLFMDNAFSSTHERFAKTIQTQIPDAKVGWDGLLCWRTPWQRGADFSKLCSGTLLLNQTFSTAWLQGELVRSLKHPGALTGKQGNDDADTAAGFAAVPWHCLLGGDNSVKWWTSWSRDYCPFNPDLSLSDFGEWFFPAAREAASGPGKLLLHATRRHSGIGIFYSQADLFATTVAGKLGGWSEARGDYSLQNEHEALLHGLHDLGFEARHFTAQDLSDPARLAKEFRVLFLVFPMCLADAQAASLRRFVEAGGTLVVDGRAGLLNGDGRIRARAALDDLLGVTSLAELPGVGENSGDVAKVDGDAFIPGAAKRVRVRLQGANVRALSPALKADKAEALFTAGKAPLLLVNKVGKGRAITLNYPWRRPASERLLAAGSQPLLGVLEALLDAAGLEPAAVLRQPDGGRPKATRLTLFSDGPLRYLGVQQDFRLPGLADQKVEVELSKPYYAYNLRTRKAIGSGEVRRKWETTLSRGRPLVYALLPYRVTGVSVRSAAAAVACGTTMKLGVRVDADSAELGFHVVRLNVFAPGRDEPHRQYSQNLACPNGLGTADIPFALNDPAGTWRVECHDVASGVGTAPLALALRTATPAP